MKRSNRGALGVALLPVLILIASGGFLAWRGWTAAETVLNPIPAHEPLKSQDFVSKADRAKELDQALASGRSRAMRCRNDSSGLAMGRILA